MLAEGGKDLFDPARSEAGVGVDVGDERACGGEEAGLSREGKPLARLVDETHAGITESYLPCGIGAGVVDDDDLGEVLEAACLMEDGFEAGAKIGLFVVRRDHEAKQHATKIAKLCVNTLNFGGRYRPD